MTKTMAAFVTSLCSSAVKLVFFLLYIGTLVRGESTEEPRCQSTGPTCLNVEDCSKVNSTYTYSTHQWCGGCRYYLICQDGTGTIQPLTSPLLPFWDDNAKSAMPQSTTCTECFYPCPPISEPPSTGPYPNCPSTGPTCVQGTHFCYNVINSTLLRFQFCGDCRLYVVCNGLGSGWLYNCPLGMAWDDVAKDCLERSTTCIQCYTYCNGNETETTAHLVMTTATMATTTQRPPSTYVTDAAGGNSTTTYPIQTEGHNSTTTYPIFTSHPSPTTTTWTPPSGEGGGACSCNCACSGTCTCTCTCNSRGN
jgi:hypothetical protein